MNGNEEEEVERKRAKRTNEQASKRASRSMDGWKGKILTTIIHWLITSTNPIETGNERTLFVDVEMNYETHVLHLFIRFIILSVRKHTHTHTHQEREQKIERKQEEKRREERQTSD